jgi:hypothetical protein
MLWNDAAIHPTPPAFSLVVGACADFRSLFETCLRLFTFNQVVCWSLASRLGKNMAAIVLYILLKIKINDEFETND